MLTKIEDINQAMNKIMDEWERDNKLDLSDLGTEINRRLKLHAKYLRYLNDTRRSLAVLYKAKTVLMAEKLKMLREGPSADAWKQDKSKIDKFLSHYPQDGKRISSNERNQYINSDDDIVNLEQIIESYLEIKDSLIEIIKQINSMSYTIRDAIEIKKFENGYGGG
jgi:hypothetical protein